MAEIARVSPIVSALAAVLLSAGMLRAGNRWPLDVPNERSLHARPVPRSGGIAMMAGVFSGFAILQPPLVVVLPAAMLVALSHFDDLRGLPISVRFGAQLAAAAEFAFGAFPAVALPFLVLIVIGILWLTHLYNFIDGSDGLAGGMTVTGFALLGAGAGRGPRQKGTARLCLDARLGTGRAWGGRRAGVPAAVRPYRANRAPCGAGSVGGPRVAAPRRPSR